VLVPKRKLGISEDASLASVIETATGNALSELSEGSSSDSSVGNFTHRLRIPVGDNKYDALSGEGEIGSVIATTQVLTDIVSYVDILHVSGTTYLLAYVDSSSRDGWVASVTISDAGAVSAVVDTLEFANATSVSQPKLIHIADDVYAVAYHDTGNTNGTIATFACDSAGTIGSVIDTGNFETVRTENPLDIIHISGNIYAVVYGLYVGIDQDDGYVKTIPIDDDGTVGAVVDTLKFEDTYCGAPSIVRVGTSDYYAIAYEATGDDGWVVTVDITSAGAIGAAITDSLEFDTDSISFPVIFHIDGNYYGVCYGSNGQFGAIATMTISTAGAIGAAVKSIGYYDFSDALTSGIVRVSTDYFAIAYSGPADDGYLATIPITNLGIVGKLRDTYEFHDATTLNMVRIVHITGTIFAICYRHGTNASIKTINIGTTKPSGYIWIEDENQHLTDETGIERTQLNSTDVDNVPVSGAITEPISSEWAYEHKNAVDPHTGYMLESKPSRTSPTELTIASGLVTITQGWHTIDTEGDAASDNLCHIAGGSDGDVLVLQQANNARDVIFKHATDEGASTGNIWLNGAVDYALNSIHNKIMLICNTTSVYWEELDVSRHRGYTEMYMSENATALTIQAQNAWHFINGFTEGLSGGTFVYHAGVQLAITAYATSDSGTKTEVTCASHGLADGEQISIAGTTNYDGIYVTEQSATDTFVIAVAYVADDGASVGEHPDHWHTTSPAATGRYLAEYSLTVTPANPNDVFEFAFYQDATKEAKSVTQQKMGAATDYQVVGSQCIIDYTTPSHFAGAVRNLSGTGNITIRNANVMFSKLLTA